MVQSKENSTKRHVIASYWFFNEIRSSLLHIKYRINDRLRYPTTQLISTYIPIFYLLSLPIYCCPTCPSTRFVDILGGLASHLRTTLTCPSPMGLARRCHEFIVRRTSVFIGLVDLLIGLAVGIFLSCVLGHM